MNVNYRGGNSVCVCAWCGEGVGLEKYFRVIHFSISMLSMKHSVNVLEINIFVILIEENVIRNKLTV